MNAHLSILFLDKGNRGAMGVKKGKWSGLKEGIIMYLAISKIFYWWGTIQGMAGSDFEEAWPLVLERILNQDLPLILVIACLIIIERSKRNLYLKLVIGYVAYIGIIFVYSLVMAWILEGRPTEGLIFFRESFVDHTMQFAVISVILSLKEHFKNKLKETPEVDDTPSEQTK